MIDLGREIASVVRADWDGLREEIAWAGMARRRRRRVAARIGLGCVVAATLAIVVPWWSRAEAPASPTAVAVQSSPGERAASVVTVVATAESTESGAAVERVSLDPGSGTRRFEAGAERGYEVHSGRFTVRAHNAVFACSRSEQVTRVEVLRGTVFVLDAAHGERQLGAGEQAEFHELPDSLRKHATAPRARWRELARDGDYEAAFAAFDASRDEPDDLMLTADVMRLSHHPSRAVEPLRRVVRDHTDDPRAALAAFTLGRVLLEELGQPREAAAAFADAMRLAPDGPMAEDALARRIEALSRAGDAAVARQLAEDYLQKFPKGRKVRSVRTFGGLE